MRGRLILIKYILNSIPIYARSVYLFPVLVRSTLHSLMIKFLWGELVNIRKFYLAYWDSISMPMDKGCLDIARMEDLNATLIVKWIYGFANERDTLWRRVVCAKSDGDPSCMLRIVT